MNVERLAARYMDGRFLFLAQRSRWTQAAKQLLKGGGFDNATLEARAQMRDALVRFRHILIDRQG